MFPVEKSTIYSKIGNSICFQTDVSYLIPLYMLGNLLDTEKPLIVSGILLALRESEYKNFSVNDKSAKSQKSWVMCFGVRIIPSVCPSPPE